MDLTPKTDLKNRLMPHATALVEKATGDSNPILLEALLEACNFLEDSSKTNTPVVALEQDVRSDTGVYHLSIRRLLTSVPAGKFQIAITRELASGVIYQQ